MKTILASILFFFIVTSGIAQNIWVNNPQDWRSGQGTIQETKITYKTSGLFMKVDWEITFTARGLSTFTEQDTVEVVYNFKLPKGAIVNDSWLWYGDTIFKARVLDRWSANQVYESIVSRRRDPSILYKNGQEYYELRIYPMPAKESRKVKISFLLPTDWTNNSVTSAFLSENLMGSKYPVEKIEVYAVLGEKWKNPVLSGVTDIPLEEDITNLDPQDETSTTYYKSLDYNQLTNNQKFEMNSPLEDGFYLGFFEHNGENFYQLALNPSEGMDIKAPQKLLFLIDYQKENSDLSQSEVLKLLANEMQGLLTEKDSFNILYYDFELKTASENWVAADSTSIYNAIESMGDSPFVSYSSLATLMASGIEYAQEREGSKMIVLANSDNIDQVNTANNLIDDLLELMDPSFPIYIGDFQTKNYQYLYVQNYYYRGNEYFYRNLAKLTGGDYISSFDGGSFTDCARNIIQIATNETGLFDIHTTLENGFCYGRTNLSSTSENPMNSVFLQVGKYSGEFPFKVEISGIYNDEIFSKNLTIEKENATPSDSLLKTFWYGMEILQMENTANTYPLINDIIDKSLENRILTIYTAFLCLEPGMLELLENIENGGPDDQWQWTTNVSISAEKDVETEITAYPNPSADRINIQIQLSETVDRDKVRFEIYDLFGKRIKVFQVDEFDHLSEIELTWDATDESGLSVPTGTYLFICSTPEGRITKKLVIL